MKPKLQAEPGQVLEHYEALRREALDRSRSGERGHGLALFLARGMSAWLNALTALIPTPPAQDSASVIEKPPLDPMPPPSVRKELTTTLAGMVLALSEEGRGVQ